MTVVVALSLALGIGANTAIFSLMRTLLMKHLPVPNPQQLVLFYWGADTWPQGLTNSGAGGQITAWPSSSRSMAYPFFRQVRDDSTMFSSVFAFAPLGIGRQNTTLAAGDTGERVDGEMVSGGFFRGLQVTAPLGRTIGDEDERTGARAAVLSHAYWTRRFGGDPSAIGQTVSVNGLPFVIVGVTPPGFFGVQPGRRPDVWIPMMDAAELVPWGYRPADIASPFSAQDYWWVHVMARLKDGVDPRTAQAAADGLFQAYVAAALPGVDRQHPPHIELEPAAGGLDVVRSTYEGPLTMLMAMAALVLLIACANIAVLLLARGMARRREFALRLSIGAGRARLVRQLLTESLVMAVAGGALGVLFASWTSRGLLLLVAESQRPLVDAPVDAGVLVFAAGVSALTAVLAGMAPALLATRVDILPALKQSASGAVHSEHPATRLWSSGFVVMQVALSLVLLVGAALFVRTLTRLQRQPLGLDNERLLVFGVDASQNGYAGDRLLTVYADILHRLEALPGVEAASATRLRLFSGWVNSGPITVPGQQAIATGMGLLSNPTGPGIAKTLGIRVLAGRDVAWEDLAGHRRIAVVNEAMARYFFGAGNAVGRRFNFGSSPKPDQEYEIVGVVADAKYNQVRGVFPRTAYIPYSAMDTALHELYFQVRTSGDPLALGSSVRGAVSGIDPGLAVVEMDTMTNQIGDSLWKERLFARLTAAFSALALTLACIGLYGTISYGAGRRRSEIAVRMALGARYRQVLWMVLRQALALASLGVVVGIPLALWGGRYVASLLFDLSPRDPATIAVTALVMVAVASIAGYLPARRAAMVDPAVALKQE